VSLFVHAYSRAIQTHNASHYRTITHHTKHADVSTSRKKYGQFCTSLAPTTIHANTTYINTQTSKKTTCAGRIMSEFMQSSASRVREVTRCWERLKKVPLALRRAKFTTVMKRPVDWCDEWMDVGYGCG
jgi:hypothetical protein